MVRSTSITDCFARALTKLEKGQGTNRSFYRQKMTENEAAYRDAALGIGFALLRFTVDHLAQHTDQH